MVAFLTVCWELRLCLLSPLSLRRESWPISLSWVNYWFEAPLTFLFSSLFSSVTQNHQFDSYSPCACSWVFCDASVKMKSSHRDLQYLFILWLLKDEPSFLMHRLPFPWETCFPHVPAAVNLTWEKDGFQFWCFPHLSIVSLKGISYLIWQNACSEYQKDLIDINTQWTPFQWHHAFRQPFVFPTLLTSWMPVTSVVPSILYAYFPFFSF